MGELKITWKSWSWVYSLPQASQVKVVFLVIISPNNILDMLSFGFVTAAEIFDPVVV